MMKSRENAQKPVFPKYFRHFRPENFLSKIGLRHIMGIAPLCQKSEKTKKPILRIAGNRRTDERTNELYGINSLFSLFPAIYKSWGGFLRGGKIINWSIMQSFARTKRTLKAKGIYFPRDRVNMSFYPWRNPSRKW